MANIEQTGIFHFQHKPDGGGSQSYPQDLRSRLLANLEPRFLMLFLGMLVCISSAVFILSFRKPPEMASASQILRIQERYASIVLNQPVVPKPKPVEKVADKKETVADKKTEEAASKEEVKVDREKETFVEKEVRKETNKVERQKQREVVQAAVKTSGIFAAITASSGSGGGSSSAAATDFLGASDNSMMSSMGSLNISKGTFATKKGDAKEILEARRSQTTCNVGIEKESMGTAKGTQFASSGKVAITTEAPKISGNESSSTGNRSMSSISQVITRETSRLKRIYEYWLKKDPALSGQIKIKFTILPSGDLANVSITSTSTNNAEFDDQILRYVKRWTFAPDPSAGPVDVVYPFVFSGQE